jgi:hypothetical protein
VINIHTSRHVGGLIKRWYVATYSVRSLLECHGSPAKLSASTTPSPAPMYVNAKGFAGTAFVPTPASMTEGPPYHVIWDSLTTKPNTQAVHTRNTVNPQSVSLGVLSTTHPCLAFFEKNGTSFELKVTCGVYISTKYTWFVSPVIDRIAASAFKDRDTHLLVDAKDQIHLLWPQPTGSQVRYTTCKLTL